MYGLALWWGNGIHCPVPQPKNTCLSITHVHVAQACPTHPLGESKMPADPLHIYLPVSITPRIDYRMTLLVPTNL